LEAHQAIAAHPPGSPITADHFLRRDAAGVGWTARAFAEIDVGEPYIGVSSR
jgi:hypothetical protein